MQVPTTAGYETSDSLSGSLSLHWRKAQGVLAQCTAAGSGLDMADP